jgi:hypothetical protein
MGSSRALEHRHHHPEVEGLSSATTAGTGIEERAKMFEYLGLAVVLEW